ncbi:MAG: hypothetical protein V4671_32780, partial [Armatimonadota bacterium]
MDEEESILSRAERSILGPLTYNIAVLAMNLGFAFALLATAYLIYGLFSGQLANFATLPQPDRARILHNISLASQMLAGGLGIGSIAAAFVLWGEDFVGYAMVLGSLLIGLGIPQAYTLIGGDRESSKATAQTLSAFPSAMLAPLVIGGILVARDVAYRLIRGFQSKPIKHEKMTYGSGAATETRPMRTSLFAKCWEGPYCREFIRVHCPIYQKRQVCWREKRGCYCEEDIVSGAAARVNGISLDMAPDPKLNFANPPSPVVVAHDPLASPTIQLGGIGGAHGSSGMGSGLGGGLTLGGQSPIPRKVTLTMAQKKERCRNCVIYNEHQREKYKILMPVVLAATVVLCAVFANPLRANIGKMLSSVDGLLGQISFNSGGSNAVTNMWQPSAGVEWVLIGALALMLVSKVLQVME